MAGHFVWNYFFLFVFLGEKMYIYLTVSFGYQIVSRGWVQLFCKYLLLFYCTEFTPRHYQLLTERRVYQELHQSKYTQCQAPDCGPIMACEAIHL